MPIASSTPPSSHTPLPTFRRSTSVSDAVKQYEARSANSTPTTPPRSSPRTVDNSPNVFDSTVKRTPLRSGRRESGAGEFGQGSPEGTSRTRMVGKSRGIGLGVPVSSKETDEGRITSDNASGSSSRQPNGSRSHIPTLSTTTRPFPHSRPSVSRTSSGPSFPRSTSDSVITPPQSKPSSPIAGPARLGSPGGRGKPIVAISVSRPSPRPSPEKQAPPLRRKGSQQDLNRAFPRSPPTDHTSPTSQPTPEGRRRSHHLSSSVSSQGSMPGSYHDSTSLSRKASSMTTLGEDETSTSIPTSIPMGRRGEGFGSRSSFDRVIELSSPRSSTSGSSFVSTSRLSSGDIKIPKRTSSANPDSPTSPSTSRFPAGPDISPRRSSKPESGSDTLPPSPTATRRASKGVVMLGEAVTASRLAKLSERPSLSRGSSASSISRASDVTSSRTETYRKPSMIPSPQQSPQSPRRQSRQSPRSSPQTSPKPSPSRRLSRLPQSSSPRKSPGLTINTPPLLQSRSSSSSMPTPPIPAKSPLRRVSRQSTGLSDSSGRAETPPTGSADSNFSVAGTPTSINGQLEKISQLERDSPTLQLQMRTPLDSSISTDRQDYLSVPTGPPSQIIATPTDDIRFTMLTAPSVYSQDSAPPSATSWALSEAMSRSSDGGHDIEERPQRRPSRLDSVGWGKMKDGPEKIGRASMDSTRSADRSRRSSSLPRFIVPVDKDLTQPPSDTPDTATTFGSSVASGDAATSHPPVTPPPNTEGRKEPSKSPSMPILRNKSTSSKTPADGPSSSRLRSPTEPMGALLPPATLRSTDNQGGSLRPLLPNSPSIVMSKRSHLIREIATTERAYAKDLALIRDAYMYRFLRPASRHSTATNGDSSISPGNISDSSRPSSVYTYQTAETKRSSGYDSPGLAVGMNGSTTPLPKSPSDSYNLGYFANSSSSFQVISQPSRKGSRSSMPPPVGRPISPADMKTVFMNIDQLASVSDELATAFEKAMGDEETGLSAIARDGEAGTDRLGQTFVTMSIKARTNAWNLDSMLIKPVQRITKYPLLFEDLLQCTTPVHPDYFAIRTAAQVSKAVAMEIDEAKRRKDLVSNVIGTKPRLGPSLAVKDAKQPASKLLGLKRFRKDKSNGTTTSLVPKPLNSDLGLPVMISESSLSLAKDLNAKLDGLDQCVKRVGKDIIFWTAAAKESLVAQDEMMKTWLRVVQLEPVDPADRRILEYRKVIDVIISDVWGDLNDEVKDRIIPIFGKLLDASINPRKVIMKRDVKLPDYTRYHALRVTRKPIERIITQNALEFVALHTQLVDELPALLEGYMRVLDIAVVAFAKAQAKYHATVKERLERFTETWIQSVQSPNPKEEPVDFSNSRGIVKAWHDSWAPFAKTLDNFQCTQPSRGVPTRTATFNNTTRLDDQPMRTESPIPTHTLRHSASITSPSSTSGSRPSSPALRTGGGRFRSSSLRSQSGPTIITTSAVSPVKEGKEPSRFNLLRRSNSKSNVPKADRPMRPPMSPRQSSGLRPSSMSTSSETSSRMSWGLPQIPADPSKPMFTGLGLSPTKSFTLTGQPRSTSDPQGYSGSSAHSAVNPYDNAFYDHDTNGSHISLASTNPGLGFGDLERAEQARRMSGSSHPAVTAIATASATPSSSSPSPSPSISTARSKRSGEEIDAAEGWRNEKVLYQCACVADFDPYSLGNRRYRGLKFLPMISGDLVDVFHEVGRIDELPSFPYPDVGVDNDGILVARAENGAIGLVICSFLEPLT
ncbi:hypothetical protein CI109_105401 [Kwoniella shandongensis]|uniref:DH domain-containing protein n=1 Tax=Kwoniella shandongensis TaxID=1734106 RepID=A0AAJ8LKB7_9TREE